MKFWTIYHKHEEDVFYNVAKDEDQTDLTEGCLLPCPILAHQIICNDLSSDYHWVKIELETLSKNEWSWSRDRIDSWDDDF